jgi:hypothetical protein
MLPFTRSTSSPRLAEALARGRILDETREAAAGLVPVGAPSDLYPLLLDAA